MQRLHGRFPLSVLVAGETRLWHPVRAVRYGQDFSSRFVDQVARDLGSALVADGAGLAIVHRRVHLLLD